MPRPWPFVYRVRRPLWVRYLSWRDDVLRVELLPTGRQRRGEVRDYKSTPRAAYAALVASAEVDRDFVRAFGKVPYRVVRKPE
jgi:hypothetical protein